MLGATAFTREINYKFTQTIMTNVPLGEEELSELEDVEEEGFDMDSDETEESW